MKKIVSVTTAKGQKVTDTTKNDIKRIILYSALTVT